MKDAKSTYKRGGKAASNAVEEKSAPKKTNKKTNAAAKDGVGVSAASTVVAKPAVKKKAATKKAAPKKAAKKKALKKAAILDGIAAEYDVSDS